MPHFPSIAAAVLFLAFAAQALRAQAVPRDSSETVRLPVAGGQLEGTLLVPRASGSIPVVLLIAGSGPTDRDGNQPSATPSSLQQLAESLATRQIATLRYDKRGVAGSKSAATSEAELRFEMFADDAAGWVHLLDKDRRFSRVIVAGHSEGALLGLLALRSAPAAGYISLEGPARSADSVIHDQLAKQLPPALMTESDTVLARLRRGTVTDSVPPALAALFRPSVQPYLISWFRYSGRQEIAQLSIPCLIVQGSHDLQVAPADADLLHEANPRCRVAMIDGMNHVLKQTPADMAGQMTSYQSPNVPLPNGLVDAIASFVAGVHR